MTAPDSIKTSASRREQMPELEMNRFRRIGALLLGNGFLATATLLVPPYELDLPAERLPSGAFGLKAAFPPLNLDEPVDRDEVGLPAFLEDELLLFLVVVGALRPPEGVFLMRQR